MLNDAAFLDHMVRLGELKTDAVRDAFAALPRRGCLEAVCAWERRLEVLAALEEVGAFAIHFEPLDGFAAVRGRCTQRQVGSVLRHRANGGLSRRGCGGAGR